MNCICPLAKNDIVYKIVHVHKQEDLTCQYISKPKLFLIIMHMISSIPGCSSWQCFFCFAFSREWIERVPPENILRVLICLRMLMRDTTFQVHNYITVNDAHFNP